MRLLLLVLALLVVDVRAECEVVIKSGDTLSQISVDVGCGAYKGTKYNVFRLGGEENKKKIKINLNFFFSANGELEQGAGPILQRELHQHWRGRAHSRQLPRQLVAGSLSR